MHSGRTRQLQAAWLFTVVAAGLLTATSWSQEAGKPAVKADSQPAAKANTAQPTAKAADSTDKELEAAATKAREGRLDEALSLIKEKAAKHPEWPPAQLILAQLLYRNNQIAPSRRALEQAAVDAPDHPDVYLIFGRMALGEGRLSDAMLNFDRAQSLVASGHWDAAKTKALRREVLAGLAAVAETREDWQTAQARLNSWLELEPNNGQIRQRLGRALFQLGKTEDAFNALTQAAKDDPALEPAAVNMAWLFSQKGDQKKAEEWFDYGRKVEPKSARVLLARATWLLGQARAADARADIDEAVKLDPALKEALKMKALVAWHLRDLAGAEAILEPLHRDAPADSAVANLLALSLIEQDDKAKRSRGAQLADVNVLQFPRSPEVLATLGWALYRAGQVDLAEQKLRNAVAGVRTTPDIAYFLARVLADKGQNADARRLLQEATRLTGAFAHRDDAMSLLKTLTK
jgi:tetratricopeptide (TPR) repeat protein